MTLGNLTAGTRTFVMVAILGFLAACSTVSGPQTAKIPASQKVAVVSTPIQVKINKGWTFTRLPEDRYEDYALKDVTFDDTGWDKVSLPHTANIEPLITIEQWQGISWYRKTLPIAAEHAGQRIVLNFDGAMNHSQVWINGTKVADHLGGYLPVVIDATDVLKYGEDNVIAVRLDNRDNADSGPKPMRILDFNMYGGLYRNVTMSISNPVHITNAILADKVAGGGIFITYPEVSKAKSVVAVQTHIANEASADQSVVVVNTILEGGKVLAEHRSEPVVLAAGSDQHLNTQITLDQANLWSPADPNLHNLKTTVLVDGVETDSRTTRFGIRSFVFQGTDLLINGEKTFLRGVNRHQEYPFVGYALSDNAQYRDAKKIKDAGFDYIRLSHYPMSPAFLDACDELGLVVLDAVLGWQYYAETEGFNAFMDQSATNLIRRDRNHPSVLAWEVSLNETQMPIPFMERMHGIVKAEYPYPEAYSAGWKNDVYDIYLQARQHRLRHYDEVQSKPYSVSEYGDWEYHSTNRGFSQEERSDLERPAFSSRQTRANGEIRLLRQAKNMQESHNDNFNTPAFSDSYWVMYDYNRGNQTDIETSGVMDIFRVAKFGYDFYRSQRGPEDGLVLEIANYWSPKSPTNVRIFGNVDQVELFVNGRSLGKQSPNTDELSTNLDHPPFTFKTGKFEPGTLKAVGYIGGKAVVEDVVRTPEAPTQYRLSLDESGVAPQAGVNDVMFVQIDTVDANGTVVLGYNEVLEFTIEGDAQLVNPTPVFSEEGIGSALIKIGDRGGTVTLTAKGPNGLVGTFRFTVAQ